MAVSTVSASETSERDFIARFAANWAGSGNVVRDAGDVDVANTGGIGIALGNIQSAMVEDNIVAHEARSNTASTASAVSPATSTRPLNAAPKVQFAPAPDYPPEERSKGIAGTTVLTLTLDAKGIVWEVEVAKSSGNRNLDQAAVNAARQWRFSPRIQGGARIASRIHVPITFR